MSTLTLDLHLFKIALYNKDYDAINNFIETIKDHVVFLRSILENRILKALTIDEKFVDWFDMLLISAFVTSPGLSNDELSRLVYSFLEIEYRKRRCDMLTLLERHEKLLRLVEETDQDGRGIWMPQELENAKKVHFFQNCLKKNNTDDATDFLLKNSIFILSRINLFDDKVIRLLVKMLEVIDLPSFYEIINMFIKDAIERKKYFGYFGNIMKIFRSRILLNRFNGIRLKDFGLFEEKHSEQILPSAVMFQNPILVFIRSSTLGFFEEKHSCQILPDAILFPDPILEFIRSFAPSDLEIAFQDQNFSLAKKIMQVAVDEKLVRFFSPLVFRWTVAYDLPDFATILLDYLLSPDNAEFRKRYLFDFSHHLDSLAQRSNWTSVFLRLLKERLSLKMVYIWDNFLLASAIAGNNYKLVAPLFELGFVINNQIAFHNLEMVLPSHKMMHALKVKHNIDVNRVFNNLYYVHEIARISCNSVIQTKLKAKILVMLIQCMDLDILDKKDRSGLTIEENFYQTMHGDHCTINKFTKKLAELRSRREHFRLIKLDLCWARLPRKILNVVSVMHFVSTCFAMMKNLFK